MPHYLQGFIHPRWCRISSINSRVFFGAPKSLSPKIPSLFIIPSLFSPHGTCTPFATLGAILWAPRCSSLRTKSYRSKIPKSDSSISWTVGSDVKEGYIAALCFVFFQLGFSRLVFACFEYLEILILESFTPWNPSKRLEPQESWRWMLQMTSFFKHFLLLSDFSW